jgi:hypothetical protein
LKSFRYQSHAAWKQGRRIKASNRSHPPETTYLKHPGTQYFKRDRDGVFSNLVMREWESYFTGEYGWPRYSEFHHALLPHPPNFTNADRVRAAEGFSQKLITVVGTFAINV